MVSVAWLSRSRQSRSKVQWIQAALALIRLTANITSWMERLTARADGFREAVALEMAAASRAMAKGTKIDGKIEKMTHDQLVAAMAKYDRSKRTNNV